MRTHSVFISPKVPFNSNTFPQYYHQYLKYSVNFLSLFELLTALNDDIKFSITYGVHESGVYKDFLAKLPSPIASSILDGIPSLVKKKSDLVVFLREADSVMKTLNDKCRAACSLDLAWSTPRPMDNPRSSLSALGKGKSSLVPADLQFDSEEDEEYFEEQLNVMTHQFLSDGQVAYEKPTRAFFNNKDTKHLPCRDMLYGNKCRRVAVGEKCNFSHEREDLLAGWTKELANLQKSIFNPTHRSHRLALTRSLDRGSWFEDAK